MINRPTPESLPDPRGIEPRAMIDWDLCIGSGMCHDASDGAIALTPTPEGPRAALVRDDCATECLMAAAAACPTLAIRVVAADGSELFPGHRGSPSSITVI